jgi:hypothetical protein
MKDASQSFGRHSRVVLAGIQGFQEWMPAKTTLLRSHSGSKDTNRNASRGQARA